MEIRTKTCFDAYLGILLMVLTYFVHLAGPISRRAATNRPALGTDGLAACRGLLRILDKTRP